MYFLNNVSSHERVRTRAWSQKYPLSLDSNGLYHFVTAVFDGTYILWYGIVRSYVHPSVCKHFLVRHVTFKVLGLGSPNLGTMFILW